MAATGLQMALNANLPAGQMGMAAAVGTGQPQLQQSVPVGTMPPTPGAQPVAVGGVPFQTAAQANFTSGSLYVGDLHTDVTETMLYDKFKDCGAILSIRLCRDVVTRRSLGYAYVNFANATDAERALDTMNFDIVKGRPIRIMWSQRDPAIRRSGVGNIYIKNLDKGIDNKALYDTFSAFGSILSCKISMDADGTSRGFGFVHFETEEAARMAIEKVNGMLLNGKKVFVGEFKQRKDRPDEAAARFKNCFVKNFGDFLDDTTLKALFLPYGEILSAKVMTDDEGESRGFGFVAFNEHDSANRAVSEMNNKEIDSNGKLAVKSEPSEEGAADAKPFKKIFVGRAMKKLERQQARELQRNKLREERLRKYNGANIFVKNLVDDIDDEKLQSQFTAFGEITSVRVMKDMHGRSRGFGFVCYSNPDEANNAIKEMNGKMIAGKPIYVALAQLKIDRQAQLQQRFLNRMMAEQRQGLASQQGYQFFANQQGMQQLPFSPTGGPAAARFPFQRPQRFPMQMGTRAQMNAPGLMINPLTGLAAGMNAGQMAGLAAGYPALGGLSVAANAQFGQQLNASFNGRQPNWNPAAMGQRGATGGGPGRPGQMAQAMAQAANAQNQMLSNQRALTGAGGANPLVQKQTAEQQAAALLKAQQAVVGINLANAPPALVQQLKQAQQTGMASADVIRFLTQSQNPALAQAPVAAPQQTVPTDSTQVELARQLASATQGEQKQILGEKLYPLIHEMHAPLAGKITGMLLEMDNSELLHMLEAPEVLRSKVSEAFDVLQQHQMAGTQPPSATVQPGGLLTTAVKEPGAEA